MMNSDNVLASFANAKECAIMYLNKVVDKGNTSITFNMDIKPFVAYDRDCGGYKATYRPIKLYYHKKTDSALFEVIAKQDKCEEEEVEQWQPTLMSCSELESLVKLVNSIMKEGKE